MDVEFSDDDLARLETDPGFNYGFGVPVVRGYRKVMRFIRAAKDERDFSAMRSFRFERLKGTRRHQHSLRINDQWRLIIKIKKSSSGNIVVIISITDYH